MDSASQILNIAERRMRQAGYNAVSYRDIAAEMGIKSASLHYHFPKKVDLGIKLVRRYSESFFSTLKTSTEGQTNPTERLIAFVDLYRNALTEQKLLCLCAVLGAEASGLPDPIAVEVKAFFIKNINWLTEHYTALGEHFPEERAKAALSTLEGAMIVSTVNNDISVFEAAARTVLITS